MISARSRLFGLLRDFVEQKLFGVIRWDDCTPVMSEDADAVEVVRVTSTQTFRWRQRNPLGAYKEIAAITFGRYELKASSSEQAPPLGSVELSADGVLIEQGPIDQRTWDKIGRIIKERGEQWLAKSSDRTLTM